MVLELAKDIPNGKEKTPSGEKDIPITQLRDIAAKVKELKKAHEATIIGEARKAMFAIWASVNLVKQIVVVDAGIDLSR